MERRGVHTEEWLRDLLPLDHLDAAARVPRFDHEAGARFVQVRKHHFVDVEAESVRQTLTRVLFES